VIGCREREIHDCCLKTYVFFISIICGGILVLSYVTFGGKATLLDKTSITIIFQGQKSTVTSQCLDNGVTLMRACVCMCLIVSIDYSTMIRQSIVF